MPRRTITHREYMDKVKNIHGDIYEFLTEFKDSKTKVRVRHIECGHTWDVNPYNLTKKKNKGKICCPNCNGGVSYSLEKFKDKVYQLDGEEYIVLGEYVNAQTKIRMVHNKSGCMYEYDVRPNDFISGSRCPKCFGTPKITQKSFENDVFELLGSEYIIVSKYKGCNKHIKVKHKTEECNHEFITTPNKLLNNNKRCPMCSGVINKDTFEEKLFRKYDGEYVSVDTYVNSKTRIRFKHNVDECGIIFFRKPQNLLLYGMECPCENTKSFQGEDKISEFLNINDVDYCEQHTFSDCKGKQVLPFDFGIVDDNNNLSFVLEYDGEQHFRPIKHFGGEEKFNQRCIYDKIKNTYCIKNNITLVRIPYWEFDNIEYILDNIILHKDNGVDIGSFLVSKVNHNDQYELS